MKELNQKKIGVVITYVLMVFNIIVGLFYSPFILERIGSSEQGISSLAGSLVSLITLLDLGFGQAIVRYITKARAEGDESSVAKVNGFFLTLYSIIAVIGLLIGIVIMIVYPNVCKNVMTPHEIYLFRVVFGILLVNVVISFPMCVFSSTLNAYEQFFALKMVNFVATVLKFASLFIVVGMGFRVISIAVVNVVFSLLINLAYIVLCIRKVHIRFEFGQYDKNLINEIFWFSFYIFLNLIIDFLYSNTDKIILGAVKGTMAVSVYHFGVYFQQYFQEMSSAMSGVFMPQITMLYDKDKDMKSISEIFVRVGRLQMALLVFVLSGYVFIGKEFILLWLGQDYESSYIIALIIMLPSVVPLTQNIGISVIRAMNIHKYRSYMYLVIAVINVAISIPLAMKWEGVGSAIGTSLATILGQIIFMNWFYGKKVKLDINGYWKNLLKYVGVTAVALVVAFYSKRFYSISSWGMFIEVAIIYSVIVFAIYWLLLFNEYEKGLIKGIMSKLFKKN